MDPTELREMFNKEAEKAAGNIRALNMQMNTPGQVELGQNAIQFQAQLMAEQDKLKVFAEAVGMIDEHLGNDTPQAQGRIAQREAEADRQEIPVDAVPETVNGRQLEALKALKELLSGL